MFTFILLPVSENNKFYWFRRMDNSSILRQECKNICRRTEILGTKSNYFSKLIIAHCPPFYSPREEMSLLLTSINILG